MSIHLALNSFFEDVKKIRVMNTFVFQKSTYLSKC